VNTQSLNELVKEAQKKKRQSKSLLLVRLPRK